MYIFHHQFPVCALINFIALTFTITTRQQVLSIFGKVKDISFATEKSYIENIKHVCCYD